MMIKKVLALTALTALIFTTGTIGNASASSTKKAISVANDNLMSTYNRGDAPGMAALYTSDGQILPPNGNFVTGRPAIQSFWQALMDMGVKEVMLETVEVDSHGSTAYEVGKFMLHAEGGQMIDKGKYIVIWKKEAGQWRLHRDIFNSSMPPPAK
jgi:uncharacterized protein (TIGR02246 family)